MTGGHEVRVPWQASRPYLQSPNHVGAATRQGTHLSPVLHERVAEHHASALVQAAFLMPPLGVRLGPGHAEVVAGLAVGSAGY